MLQKIGLPLLNALYNATVDFEGYLSRFIIALVDTTDEDHCSLFCPCDIGA